MPGAAGKVADVTSGSARSLGRAMAHLYAEGGIAAFWVGNGLNIVKIFPESAIKFLSYESSKRFFARYVDKVDDSRNISGTSRFISGGIGGITSQLAIYPIETLKTQMMSATGGRQPVLPAIKRLWAMGGTRAFYRGLTIGLVGVFPYSAIDMSTFEALKLAYVRSTGVPEPGVLALLAFGSISGSVGATSVYPLNLVRTRLQASGSSGHPQAYDGILDVARKTMKKEGWRGFYKGLLPTLAKVVPAVSISYVVYETSKRRLGV
ncbi:Calcium-binding mitochondrial carrier SAL1 OS=Saccharomyces cerevisiae GN=SAL1 PE=3 SV=1 [Rhizoctonia solani AG-1 IB]|nr:Calcium-binding mitochondrial carrier SAL1 OS=Saccharomyces cerevisiae GN=SAL1 PE=3 SV=1 [Rhizoctonia solani AG-1 IB]